MGASVVALGLLAAFGVAALSSAPGRRRPPGDDLTATASVPGPPRPRARARARAPGARTALERRELRAIDATLGYTPFITQGSGRRREIALTFDDGPSQYTDAVLRVLARKHAPATFFIVGEQLNRFAAPLGDELRQRLTVGDHTESHAWLARLKPRAQRDQIDDAALRIRHGGARFPRLFRPPYGAFNRATLKVLGSLRMLLVLWSVDPGDWRRPGVGPIVSGVISHARPGAIVLLHDGGGYREQTVAALPSIIDGLRRRHFDLVTVPRLILDDPPPRHQRLPSFAGGGL